MHLASTDDAALAPAAGHDRRVARPAAGGGQDARGLVHALDVFGARELAHQDHLLTILRALDGLLGREGRLADRSARRGRNAARQHIGRLLLRRIKAGEEELREIARGDAQERRLLIDEALAHHVARDLHRRDAVALAGARLEHVQDATLDRELDVLHVLVVLLELVLDLDELLVDLLVPLGHLVHGQRRANARHHVLALSVHEVLAVEDVVASRGVTREGHARARVLAHVAVDHRLDVHGRAVEALDALDAAVGDRAVAVPAAEDGLDRELELLEGVLREDLTLRALVDRLVRVAQLDHALRWHVGIKLRAVLVLDLVERLLEEVVVHAHHHIAEHLDQAAVAVVRETRVARRARKPGNREVSQAQVQDGVHHARHRDRGTRSNRDQQRVRVVTELLARVLLDQRDVLMNLVHQAVRQTLPVAVVIRARVCRDGKAGRNRQADARHVREVRPLATQQRLLVGSALGQALAEEVDHFAGLVPGVRNLERRVDLAAELPEHLAALGRTRRMLDAGGGTGLAGLGRSGLGHRVPFDSECPTRRDRSRANRATSELPEGRNPRPAPKAHRAFGSLASPGRTGRTARQQL